MRGVKNIRIRWEHIHAIFKMTCRLEYNIRSENIYNMIESGFSIGTVEASKIIINKQILEYYQAHPGRQEWVTFIECICGDGTFIPPLFIFRAEKYHPHGFLRTFPAIGDSVAILKAGQVIDMELNSCVDVSILQLDKSQ